MKNNYKPKAKNEIALKTYIKNATNKSIKRDNRSYSGKWIGSRNNHVC